MSGRLATNAWTVVAATTAVQAFASTATLSVPTIAPRLAELLGISPSLIGWQTSLIYLGAMTMSVFGGAAARRLGAGRASQIALLLAATGVLLVIGGSLWTMAIGSVVMGLGYGLTNPSASQLLMRFARGPRMNLIFSIKQTGVPWGGMIAGLMLPPVALAFGWRVALVLVVILCVVLIATLAWLRRSWDDDRDPRQPIRQSPLAALALVWRIPALRHLAIASMALAAAQMCVLAFLVTLLVAEVGFGLVEAGFTIAIVQVAGVIGRIAWGVAADRFRDAFLTMVALTAIAVAGFLATATMTPAWPRIAVYAVAALFGATAVGWNGVFMAEIARQAPADKVAMATGGTMVMTFSCIIVVPPAFGTISQAIGSYAMTYGLVGAVTAVAGFSLLAARRAARRTAA
ncbi:MAG: MFS transporter [Alphaproteobacteria bacterium]